MTHNPSSKDVPAIDGSDVLTSLNLRAEDLAALRQNGNVEPQIRRGKGPYFRLRFRLPDGRQRVRYLGQDVEKAHAVQATLNQLQLPRQQQRQLRQLNGQARRLLRQTKRNLQQPLSGLGIHFHGFALRRIHKPSLTTRNQP